MGINFVSKIHFDSMMAYKFQAKIVSRGYHVYKNIWDTEKAGDEVIVELETNKKINAYFCVIKAIVGNPAQLKTVGHILRKISRYGYFLSNGREWQNCWFCLFRDVLTPLHPSWRIGNTTIKF